MQALAMVGMGAKRAAAAQPERPVANKTQEFAAVLNGQQRPVQPQQADAAAQQNPAQGAQADVAAQQDPAQGAQADVAAQQDPAQGAQADVAAQQDPAQGAQADVAAQQDPAQGAQADVAAQQDPAQGAQADAAVQQDPVQAQQTEAVPPQVPSGKPAEDSAPENIEITNRAEQTADGEGAAAKGAEEENLAVLQARSAKPAQLDDRAEVTAQIKQLAKSLLQELTDAPQGPTDPQSRPVHEQNLLNLLDKLAAAERSSGEQAFSSLKSLLGALVEQLDGSDLAAEQELTGGGLSTGAEQIEQLLAAQPQAEESAAGVSLKQLLTQLTEMFNTEAQAKREEQSGVDSIVPAAMPEKIKSSQIATAATAEVLTKTPRPTNETKGQEAAGRQREPQTVATAAAPVAVESVVAEETAEPIDPRFAGLLKPNAEDHFKQQLSLRERIRGEQPVQPKGAPGLAVAAEPTVAELTSGQAKLSEFLDAIAPRPQQFENLNHLTQGAQQQAGGQVSANLTAARTLPESAANVQLPSGQQVAESQIFDQVVTRFSGSFNGDSGRMTLRLQPAELGSLKLDLKVEGDRITANFQAQSQQVQEILERNLPQLRSALAEQGLKIDQFQVDVNQQQNRQGPFDNQAQQQQQGKGFRQSPSWKQSWQEDEQAVPLAHLVQNGGRGISLHV